MMDCSLAKSTLKSNVDFYKRVRVRGVMTEQVKRRDLSCAQDVILDSCRETRAEQRAKFSIIIASHRLKEEPV